MVGNLSWFAQTRLAGTTICRGYRRSGRSCALITIMEVPAADNRTLRPTICRETTTGGFAECLLLRNIGTTTQSTSPWVTSIRRRPAKHAMLISIITSSSSDLRWDLKFPSQSSLWEIRTIWSKWPLHITELRASVPLMVQKYWSEGKRCKSMM